MWSGDAPLYKLPGCRALRPLAGVTLAAAPTDVVTMELLATSDPLPPSPARSRGSSRACSTARREVSRPRRRQGGPDRHDRAGLELTVDAFHTGATSRPTLVGGYTEAAAAGARAPGTSS